MQIASLNLNFYHQAADSIGLHVITWKKRKFRLKQNFLSLFLLNHGSQEYLQTNKILMDNVSVEYFMWKKLCDFLK